MLPCLEATYSKSKNAVTSTPSSQNKSLTSVSQARLYPICAKEWKSIQILDERRTIFSICPYRKKIFLNSHSRRIWWKILGKACFNIQNSSFLSSSSLRYADQIQQKKREHILVNNHSTLMCFPLLNPPVLPGAQGLPASTTRLSHCLCWGNCATAEYGFCHHISATKQELCHFTNKTEEGYRNAFPCLTQHWICRQEGFLIKAAAVITVPYHCPSSQGLSEGHSVTGWEHPTHKSPSAITLNPPQIPGTSC